MNTKDHHKSKPGLSITRNESQRIMLIDSNGELLGSIQVQNINGNKVRLKLDFPKNIGIEREEIYEARLEEVRLQNRPLNPLQNR